MVYKRERGRGFHIKLFCENHTVKQTPTHTSSATKGRPQIRSICVNEVGAMQNNRHRMKV
jgi:hypothetical protein